MATPAPLTNDELQRMPKEEVIAYFAAGGDMTDVLRHGKVSGHTGPVPKPEDIPMLLTSIRLPMGMVEELDEVAGNTKDGRSGFIREAVAKLLAERREAA